jgi:CRISPR-associated protein Csm2
MASISPQDLHTIVADPSGAETMVKCADQLGRDLKNQGLSTNQIRSLFGEVRQIQAQWSMGDAQQQLARRRVVLLKPKMAYRSRRERGKGVQDLVAVLDPALNEVIKEKDPKRQREAFQRFVEFFEAILAYHKAYGGN